MYSLLPLLALLPAVLGAPATSWWKPTKANTFLYEADNVAIQAPTITTNTGLKLTKDVYIVDMEGHSAAQIKAYKDKGKKVVCYLSAGSWEPWRKDALKFTPACYCGAGQAYNKADGLCKTTKNKMDGWNEWWLDIKTPTCLANIKPIMAARIKAAKDKGCDGVDPDNMDSYANEVSYGATDKNQFDYLMWFAQEAHNQGMAVGLKNAGNLLSSWEGDATPFQTDLVANFDFSVIESCTQYKECHVYDSILKAGKPQIRVEYKSSVKKCPAKVDGVTFSVYSGETLNTKQINLDC